MIVELIAIPSLRMKKVSYYSVKLEGKLCSEFKDFENRMSNAKDSVELSEIKYYLNNIGNILGANDKQFRDEDSAEALPPPYHKFIETDEINNYGLRLYCIRLSPSIVVLLNGARKTALKSRLCDNCRPHFDKANSISKKITEAILEKNIEIDEENKKLKIEDDFELII